MNKKMNNKGFSLVELIVVIAIMAILAVTLAPRLTQYLDKSRRASDQEVVNTIYTAAKLANVEYPLGESDSVSMDGAADAAVFTQDGTDFKKWTLNNAYTTTDQADFLKTMIASLSNFNLKSSDTVDATTFTLETDANGNITVLLDYDGDTVVDEEDIQIQE